MNFQNLSFWKSKTGFLSEVQEGITQQMRNLSPGENTVMQLNMGEGKSSVIVPIVATTLANK